MAKNKGYNVKFVRSLKFITNYKKRLRLVKSRELRLVIRPHLNNIVIQFVEFNENGDKVLISVNSTKLYSLGWKANRGNIPTAYLTGFYTGLLAKKQNIKKAILDTGNFSSVKGSRIYASLKGILDSGIEVPHAKEILPDDDTISGKIIVNYAKLLEKNHDLYTKMFNRYLKNNIKPEELNLHFQEIKNKIISEIK